MRRDVYVCPNGKLLRTSGTVHDSRVRNDLSQPQECRACTLKHRCTRAPFKKMARDINEEARNHARSLKGKPEFERSSNARKKVEMRFAHLKVQQLRASLRGLTDLATSFTSPPWCRTSRRWRCAHSARQPVECARRLRKWHGNLVRGVRRPGRRRPAGSKPKRFFNCKANYGRAFFDSIDPTETLAANFAAMHSSVLTRRCGNM
jgi:hypothetical protein